MRPLICRELNRYLWGDGLYDENSCHGLVTAPVTINLPSRILVTVVPTVKMRSKEYLPGVMSPVVVASTVTVTRPVAPPKVILPLVVEATKVVVVAPTNGLTVIVAE